MLAKLFNLRSFLGPERRELFIPYNKYRIEAAGSG
jgi:hypothetical protein